MLSSISIIVSIHPTQAGICPSCVVSVRSVERIPYRCVISSIGSCKYVTETYCWSNKEPVEGSIHISSVVYIDKSCIVTKNTSVIVHMQSTNSTNPTVVVPNVHISDLGDTSIVIVKYGNVLYLDYSSVVVILYKWVIIESRVESNPNITYLRTYAYIYSIIHVEVELTIGVNGERYTTFHKNE